MTQATEHGVLVGVDGSPESHAALRWAAEEATMRCDALTIMHVIDPIRVSWQIETLEDSYSRWQEENSRHVLEEAVQILGALRAQPSMIRSLTRRDGVVNGLKSASACASMLVLGSRGLGPVGGMVLGSVSRALLRHAQPPVAIIKADAAKALNPTAPVLLGTDGSAASDAATERAFDEAARRSVDLVALHAWSDVGVFPVLGMDWREHELHGHKILAEHLAPWQDRFPDVQVHRRIVCDRPARWLIDESRHAQLVVVGSRGRGGVAGLLLGSVSAAVAESACAPVIVVG